MFLILYATVLAQLGKLDDTSDSTMFLGFLILIELLVELAILLELVWE